MSPKINALDIKRDIEYSIIRGKYNKNYKLPSINNIIEMYHCSKGTAVKVIDMMEAEGIIVKKKGIGCFLVPQKNVELFNKYKSKAMDELFKKMVSFKELGLDKESVYEMVIKVLYEIYKAD